MSDDEPIPEQIEEQDKTDLPDVVEVTQDGDGE